MAEFCPDLADENIGVAVSGGGDSIALLLLLVEWSKATDCSIHVATVDHGLRPESATEAVAVAQLCEKIGLSHQTLQWRGRDGKGNLQAEARSARRRLLARWAQQNGIGVIALGHTMDDQAETVLMRLARGSGVDGLAAMQGKTLVEGIYWIRPLLGIRRMDLRDYLTARNVTWVDDPSNEDLRFDRVKMRRALEQLEPLGIGVSRLAGVADSMQRAKDALQEMARDHLAKCVKCRMTGDALLDWSSYAVAREEVQLRVLSAVLCWVSGASYRPRLKRLLEINAAAVAGQVGTGLTFHGCVLRQKGEIISICREFAQVEDRVPMADRIWDRKWRVINPDAAPEGASIGALGPAGLAQVDNWRDTGFPRETLLTAPGIWLGDRLEAAPAAGLRRKVSFELVSCDPILSSTALLR